MTIFSRISRWFSIREKLLIAFVGLSAIPLAIVGVHGIVSNVQMMEQIAIENLTHDVHTIREKTANFLANVEQDLNVFRNSSLLQEFVNVSETLSVGPSAERILRQLTAELLAFAQTKKIYYQIRMLDRRGDEFFRIEAEHNANLSPARPQSGGRTYRVVPATQTPHIRENYYFFLIEELEPVQIACVPVELRYGERGQVAAISFVMPIVTPWGVAAILIANVFAEELFKVLEPAGRFAEERTVVLVNAEGHNVYHSQKKNKWDLLLASRDEVRRLQVRSGDVLINIIGASIGRCAVYDDTLGRALLNQNICLIRCKENIVQPAFLCQLFLSKRYQGFFKGTARGGAQYALNARIISELEVPCPSLSEQRRFASLVEKIESLPTSSNPTRQARLSS